MEPKEIESIRLEDVMPCVFANEKRPASDVWSSSLLFKRGQCYLVQAESGAGKSSLCSYLYGLRNDYTGAIYFNNLDIRQLGLDQWCSLRRTQLALLPQEMRLFPELTVWENIQLKNRLTHHLSDADVTQMLQELEIMGKRDIQARYLSVGQQQRVAIIRALAQPFAFIFLDEPVSHLDERNNRIAAQLILSQAQKQGASVISTSVGNPLLLPSQPTIISL